MKSCFWRNCQGTTVSVVIVIFALTGCAPLKPISIPKMVRANAILMNVGKFAEDSFYSCMLNGYMQGLPLAQIQDECSTKLIADNNKGFGGSLGKVTGGGRDFSDSGTITTACGNTADPRLRQTSGSGFVGLWGGYTYGGNPNKYWGLTKEESERQKKENIAHAENEEVKSNALQLLEIAKLTEVKEAKAKGDTAAAAKAEEERKPLYEAAAKQTQESILAKEKAKSDPNEKPLPVGRPVAGQSPCEEALQTARELLRECHRTEWKDMRCQKLQAKLDNCPDPTLILVDPEQGYSCGKNLGAVAKEELENRWVDRCEQRVRYGPDGENPCRPPSVDPSGRYVKGNMGDICNDPHAYIAPDSEICAATFNINEKPFGTRDIQEIIVLGQKKLGGPIIVIPRNPKPLPHPGPDPRPGPL